VGPTCCDSCPPIGCENPDCCTTVCNYGADGLYCCQVEWDDTCASLANEFCPIQPANDVCAPTRVLEGARLLVIGPSGFVTAETDSGRATEDADDPGFGCYKNYPGKQGLQTVWYKFVATQTSALFQTCQSNAPADDSLLEVFAVGDPSDPLTQCRTLIPIGCSDDIAGCSNSSANARSCVRDLIPGNLYYVLVAAKFAEAPGIKYRLDIVTPYTGSWCDTVTNPTTLVVAPGGATDFGSLAVGTTAERGFTLRNTGSNTIVGSASAPAPFSIVSGASYNLAPGQTQAVTVRYSPTQPGNNIAYITFTGTGTQQRQLLGSAFATPINGSVAGTVVEDDATDVATAGQPIAGAVVSIAGGRAVCAADGSFSVHGLVPGTYTLTATSPSPIYLTTGVGGLTVTGGLTAQVSITLPRRIVPPPPVPGQRNTPVLLVSGFGCTDPPWDTHSCNDDYCGFTCDGSTWENVRISLRGSGYEFPNPTNDPDKDYVGELVWDPNEPTPGESYPLAGDILRGTERILPDNARRLKDYVTAKIIQFREKQGGFEPASIDIVASSMGGLITRQFLTDRQLDVYDHPSQKLNLKVGKVIMIGTPNAGTVLADYALDRFYRKAIFWFACDWSIADSIHDLTIFNARQFHRLHDWPRDVRLYLLIGNEVPESGCWKLRKGHEILESNALSAEERVSDGAVPEPSVLGVYSEMRDVYGYHFPETHYEFRLPYEGVPKRMPIDHLWLKQDTAAVAWIQGVLTGSQVASVAEGRDRPLDSTPTVAETAPPSSIVDDQVFVLAPGEGTQWVIPIDAATTLRLLLSADDGMTSATVQDPDGNVVAATEVNADPWTQTYDVAAPTPGEWTVSFSLDPAATASAGVSVFAAGDGPVALIPTTEDAILNSQHALVSCALNAPGEEPGGVAPVTGATVLVDVALPDGTTTQLALLDDGLHSDGPADDGTYAAIFTTTAQAGSYRLRYRADGTAGGLAFRRVALGTFGVSSAAARISGNLTDEAVDFDADGFADFLRVQFWVTAQQAGTYLASGLVVDETGQSTIAGSETALELPIGTSTVSLLFDCRKLAVPGTYGPFSLQNLELFERRDDQIAWVDRYREAYTLATAQIEVPCPPFDGDCDGDRDLRDFAGFQRCFGLTPIPNECRGFDVDGVEGVGLEDCRAMSEILGDADRGGPKVVPTP